MKLYGAAILSAALSLSGCGEGGDEGSDQSDSGTPEVIQFSLPLELTSLEQLDAGISSVSALNQDDSFSFSDIRLTLSGSDWQISNPTPQPVSRLMVRYNEQKPALLVLSSTLPAYSQANLEFPTHTITELKIVDQLALFEPTVQVKGFNADCSDSQKTCYDDLKPAEREMYETIVINIRNAFNRRSFMQAMDSFFADRCQDYSGCRDYSNNGGLSYARRNLLMMGLAGHSLGLKAMRNVYAAEGMGGGSSPDISQFTATSGGWASLWEGYITPGLASYRPYEPISYDHLFHEIAHAYGFNHDSGMSYGFAEQWGYTYAQNQLTTQERETRNPVVVPDMMLDVHSPANGQLDVRFYRSTQSSGAIDLSVLSASKQNVTLSYQAGSDQARLVFDPLPSAPVYLRAVSESGDYMATVKLRRSDFVTSPSYSVDGVKYTVLDDALLDSSANGWAIRASCDQPGQQLATKADYQKLWDYLSANGRLSELHKTRFLSRDEPSGYVIWLLAFLDTEMQGSWYGMTNAMGDDKGLVCVESL